MSGLTYIASPTSARFHADDNAYRFIMGPVGSGKTSAGLMEVFLRALAQQPQKDGIRRSRAAIIRNTFPELRTTTIPSWIKWFGDICEMKYTTPFESRIYIPDLGAGDGTGLDLQVYFIALDDPKQTKKLQSFEITFGFVDECVHVDKEIVEVLFSRCGRYPDIQSGGPTWSGVWGTTNPCSVDHWFYRWEEQELERLAKGTKLLEGQSGVSFYHNPPGLVRNEDGDWSPNPGAENLAYLPKHYYMSNTVGKEDDWIKVFLCGEYGDVRSGKPVYSSYNDATHCVTTPLQPMPGVDITIGIDIGIHGMAAAFTQLTPTGQLLVFDEINYSDLSITEFVNDYLKPHIALNYGSYNFRIIMDPAARQRSQSDKKSALDIFTDPYGAALPAELAPTNDFVARKEAVVYFLTKNSSGEPGLLLSPSCKDLRRGFISQYKYAEVKGSSGMLKEKPDKNKYSHPHDALQYAALAYKYLKVRRKTKIPSKYTRRPMSTVAGY